MKLLFVVSSLDLTQAFSATPAWWQLLKGLYEIGVDVIATPYQGPAIESLWWQAKPNPARWQGDGFKLARDALRALLPKRQVQMQDTGADAKHDQESASDKLARSAAQKLIAPLWQRHMDAILTQQPDIDAVIFLTVPLNHLIGVPEYLQTKHNIPVLYYDGDVPASLPNMRGFASGFRIYQGADLGEYAAFISNSTGGADLLHELGAANVHVLWYGADPDVFNPVNVPQQNIDVLFYGHGAEYRAEWIQRMITAPSQALPEARFAVRGTRLGHLGLAEQLPYSSFSKLREYASRSKINLCITRGAHASVYGSSSSRPFELASMGCCIVANPYVGVELWFEPERELIVVESEAEAIERYRYLLRQDSERRAIGAAARQRVLKQHTFRHRAQSLLAIITQYT